MRRSVLAALFGAAACYGVLAITEPPGPGLDPDSMSYLGAAESLVRHGTLRIPMASWAGTDSTAKLAHFPPGFSLAIAVPVALGAPPEQAARGVEALAAFATVGLAVWLVATISGPVAALLTGAVLLETPSLLLDHVAVLSEPICLALLLATWTLMVFSKKPLAYGITAAAAAMVRYAALAATGAAILWAFGLEGKVRDRIRRAALAAAPTLLMEGFWALRSHAASDYSRGGALAGLGRSLAELVGTMADWLAPSLTGSLPRAVLSLAVAGGATTILLAARRAARADPRAGLLARSLRAAGLLAGCHLALVLVSRVVVDDRIPFDERILSPLFLTAEIAVIAALGVAWRGWRAWARALSAVALALWMAGTALSAADVAGDVLDNGWDYGRPQWRGAPLGEWLRTQAASAEIFSNNPAIVYFMTGRPSRDVPLSLAPDTLRVFERTLSGHHAVLVRFPYYYDRMASPDSIAARLGLTKLAEFSQGVIWEK